MTYYRVGPKGTPRRAWALVRGWELAAERAMAQARGKAKMDGLDPDTVELHGPDERGCGRACPPESDGKGWPLIDPNRPPEKAEPPVAVFRVVLEEEQESAGPPPNIQALAREYVNQMNEADLQSVTRNPRAWLPGVEVHLDASAPEALPPGLAPDQLLDSIVAEAQARLEEMQADMENREEQDFRNAEAERQAAVRELAWAYVLTLGPEDLERIQREPGAYREAAASHLEAQDPTGLPNLTCGELLAHAVYLAGQRLEEMQAAEEDPGEPMAIEVRRDPGGAYSIPAAAEPELWAAVLEGLPTGCEIEEYGDLAGWEPWQTVWRIITPEDCDEPRERWYFRDE